MRLDLIWTFIKAVSDHLGIGLTPSNLTQQPTNSVTFFMEGIILLKNKTIIPTPTHFTRINHNVVEVILSFPNQFVGTV